MANATKNRISIGGTPRETIPEEHARLRVIVLTVALSIVWVITVAGRPWSYGRTAATLSCVNLIILCGYTFRQRDPLLFRLLLFAATVGVIELFADALCVRFTGTLSYAPARSAMLLLSPWWMPLSWMVVAAQIGYLGALLMDWLGPVRGAMCAALLGAVNIPFYEEMAFYAHWWQYGNCRMVGHTPIYIIVAELLIGLAFAPLARAVLHASTHRTVLVWGILGGLATVVGGLIGYGVVERIIPFAFGERSTILFLLTDLLKR